ncbi:hypothetical protein PSACC_00350 [Paramicrosporidium saccamoebae]|uniref:Uncharacterized protein n=1 Tax=Paramicrosporidium saccamoebae TaxID=1246581 RepID=A0A2H9TQ08_9FUNG|nr:hypothetical protein PSACC_00350 [Paramicrosporidium saccamoebae]
MVVGDVLEPVLVGCSFLAYVLYHLYFWQRYKRRPMYTTVGHNHEARLLWCQAVMQEGKELLAIQTIRNTLMSSSLLASTSLTLSAVTAAYLINTIHIHGPLGLDLLASSYLRPIHKFFGVIVCFTVAFYCYMQSVRASNHVGYLLGVPLTRSHHFTPQYVAKILRRGADFHTAGTRIFYLAFLFVLWIFGPLPPTILTLLLIPHLWYLDRADPYIIDSHPSPIFEEVAMSERETDTLKREADLAKSRKAAMIERETDPIKSEKAAMVERELDCVKLEKAAMVKELEKNTIPTMSEQEATPSTSKPTSPV